MMGLIGGIGKRWWLLLAIGWLVLAVTSYLTWSRSIMPVLRLAEVGGEFMFSDRGSYNREPEPYSGLPEPDKRLKLRHHAGEVNSITLESDAFTDAEAVYLRRFTKAETIQIISKNFTDQGLAHIADLTSLECLVVHAGVTDDGLRHLQRLKKLKTLILSGAKVTGEGLGHLANLQELRNLVLMSTSITDGDLEGLGALKALTSVYLNETNVTGAGLVHLQELPKLRAVRLSGSMLDDDGLAQLSALRVRDWSVARTQVTDTGMRHLENCPELDSLDVSHTAITDAGLEKLHLAPKLEWLDLTGTAITDACIPMLAALPELTWLCLADTGITDAGLRRLAEACESGGFAKLQSIDLSNLTISDAAVAYLQLLPNLREVDLSGTQITDASTDSLLELQRQCYARSDLFPFERLTIAETPAAAGAASRLAAQRQALDQPERGGGDPFAP